LAPVPVLAVVERREAETGQVFPRRLGGSDQTVLTLADAVALLSAEAMPLDFQRK